MRTKPLRAVQVAILRQPVHSRPTHSRSPIMRPPCLSLPRSSRTARPSYPRPNRFLRSVLCLLCLRVRTRTMCRTPPRPSLLEASIAVCCRRLIALPVSCRPPRRLRNRVSRLLARPMRPPGLSPRLRLYPLHRFRLAQRSPTFPMGEHCTPAFPTPTRLSLPPLNRVVSIPRLE